MSDWDPHSSPPRSPPSAPHDEAPSSVASAAASSRDDSPSSSPPSGRDYIGSLPDGLIQDIVSFLPTEDAVKTSLLSKQWRSTWTSCPHIKLCFPKDRLPEVHNFIRFVGWVLSHRTATEVKRFVFDAAAYHPSLDSTVDDCLKFVTENQVRELSLALHDEWSEAYVVPPDFFQLTTLVSLQLSRCSFWLMGAVRWSWLKILRIEYTQLFNPMLKKLMTGCPVLEYLGLKGCEVPKLMSVESRGLRELVIDSPILLSRNGSNLYIRGPHLLKLRLLGANTRVELRLDEVSSLVEAELNFSMRISGPNSAKARADLVKRLLEKLRHVPRLIIGSWCLQVLSLTEARVFLPSFEFRHLTCHVAEDHEGVPGIVKILESSPSLEKIEINGNNSKLSKADDMARTIVSLK